MMSPEEAALRHRVEQLYDVFGIYPLADVVEGCPCCTTEEDHLRIRSKPLRQLEGGDLDRFARKALSTWGNLDDFKHFLPRLLELLAFEWNVFTMPEALLGTLMYSGTRDYPSPVWTEWPDQERLALDGFFRALWVWRLVNPGSPSAVNLLQGLAQACQDLSPFLDLWWSLENDEGAVAQLAYFWWYYDATLQRGAIRGAYWANRPEGAEQLFHWTQHPRTLAMLKLGLPGVGYTEWLHLNGVTQDWIDWILAS